MLKAVFHFNRIVPKRSIFLCLVSFEGSHLTLALFYKDQAGKMDAVNPLADAADANEGLRECDAHTSESKSVAMQGRNHLDLFAIDRYILGAVRIKIKIVRSRNPFCLVSSADNPDFKVVLEECVFRIPQS